MSPRPLPGAPAGSFHSDAGTAGGCIDHDVRRGRGSPKSYQYDNAKARDVGLLYGESGAG